MKQKRGVFQLTLAACGIALVVVGTVLIQPEKNQRPAFVLITKAESESIHRRERWRKAAPWIMAGGFVALVGCYFAAEE